MRNAPSREITIAAAGVVFILTASTAGAQYYPGRYDRFERYDPYSRYDRRYDGYSGRLAPSRSFDDDETPPRRERVREQKSKHREAKPEKQAKAGKPVRGPYQIVVSIASQRIYLYGADGLIRESRVSTGMRGHSTPTGIFSVIEKDYYHRSNIYSNAPMPLMQRITWSGVALHQGVLPGYPASHGCIRMNAEFAKFLWSTTAKGTRVIVARGEIDAPKEIASPKLFTLVVKPVESAPKTETIAKNAANEIGSFANLPIIENEAPGEAVAAAAANEPSLYKVAPLPGRKGQIAAFISRKTGKLHVRYAQTPLFETTVEIKDSDKPLGTHVFTATELADDGKTMKWMVVSLPVQPPITEAERRRLRKVADIDPPKPSLRELPTAAAALDRIEIPAEAARKIGELLSPGASLIVSDYGISDETGDGTDFIIRTR